MSVSGSGLRRVLVNLGHLLGGKAVAGLLSLLYLVIMARTLGATDYGVLVLVHGYIALLGSLVAFSGFHGLVRYGALALEDGNLARFARLARLMALIELVCGVTAISIGMVLAPLVGPRLGWPDEATRFALYYSFAIVASVRATPQALLQIAGRFDLIGLHQTVSPLIRLGGALVVWGIGGGLIGFLAAWLMAAVAECLAMWIFAYQIWRRMETGEAIFGGFRGVAVENEGFIRFILITNFDISLRELTPNLVPLTIGWFLGPTETGLFALVQRASSILRQPAVLLSQASYAVLSDLAVRKEWAALSAMVWKGAGLALAIALPIMLLLSFYSAALLVLLGGESFTNGANLLFLVAAARALTLGFTPVGGALIAMGLPERSVTAVLLSDVALYPLLPFLLLCIGINGAGLQVLGQSVIASLLVSLFFTRAVHGRREGD